MGQSNQDNPFVRLCLFFVNEVEFELWLQISPTINFLVNCFRSTALFTIFDKFVFSLEYRFALFRWVVKLARERYCSKSGSYIRSFLSTLLFWGIAPTESRERVKSSRNTITIKKNCLERGESDSFRTNFAPTLKRAKNALPYYTETE